jgi:hypothetical protein
MPAASAEPYDHALAILAGCEPEYGRFDLSSHVPMAVEALDRLGAPEAIAPYVDGWLPRLRRRTSARTLAGFWDRVDEATRAIADLGPSGALAAWFERLGPGLIGGALHGTLRVAHAVRGLARADRAPRRAELAHAMAYAAGVAEPLPAMRPGGARALGDVLGAIAPADAVAASGGLIMPQLRARVTDLDHLVAAVSEARLPDEPLAAAGALRDQAARIFTCARHHPSSRFTLLHGVTGMDAIVALVAVVPRAHGERLVRHAAVALAALLVAFGGPIEPAVADVPRSWAPLRAVAIASRDDHAIKLASAVQEAIGDGCDPALYLAALAQWLETIATAGDP